MYLVQRRRVWWAYHDTPKALHRTYGRRLRHNLETSDYATAKRLSAILWAHDWSRLVGGASSMKADEAEARFFAQLVKKATGDEYDALIDHVGTLAERRYDNATTDEGRKAALKWNRAAQGRLTATSERIDEWLAGLRDKPSTRQQKRRAVDAFAAAFPWVEEVQTRDVQTWVTERTRKEKLAASTVDCLLAFVRGYWRHLVDAGVTEANPIRDVRRPKIARPKASYVPYTPLEAVQIREAARARGDDELVGLIEMGMWSGCRIEELCSLAVPHVDLKTRKAFRVVDSKTKAGLRDVPIHPKLFATLKRLIGSRKDGYVLAGLTTAPASGLRSGTIGHRFGDLKRSMGFGDDKPFHSFRKCVATQLENTGCPESVAADILGHDKTGSITYGIYSGGASLEVKRAAIARLSYPASLGPQRRSNEREDAVRPASIQAGVNRHAKRTPLSG